MRECSRRFGFSLCSWQKAAERGDVDRAPASDADRELLVADRPQTNRSHLKQRLIAEGRKENRCERCGISEWLGDGLNMEIHHVNGNGKDNREENLRMLCPNCHAQTPNWGGRNRRRLAFARIRLRMSRCALHGPQAATTRRRLSALLAVQPASSALSHQPPRDSPLPNP